MGNKFATDTSGEGVNLRVCNQGSTRRQDMRRIEEEEDGFSACWELQSAQLLKQGRGSRACPCRSIPEADGTAEGVGRCTQKAQAGEEGAIQALLSMGDW